ncbi:MAG: entericidin A/B family lipoprotein [Ottowia sp.]|nr:entericidin A/B family lipoprotein [Ottowia sp.]
MGKSFLSLAMLVATLLLSACNTVSGVGKDIKAGGQAVEDASKK